MFRGMRSKGTSQLARKRTVVAYRSRSDACYLVSFPRTGSHWLRMVCEQYTDRPTLVRSFYAHDNDDYLFMHVHDVDLRFRAGDVMYLYRHPLPTVYSTMKYHQVHGEQEVVRWAGIYAAHLRKWLVDETCTRRKTLLRYEDLPDAFALVADHLGVPFDPQRLADVARIVTPEHVRGRTSHDPRVMQRDDAYTLQADEFAERYGQLVDRCVFGGSPDLRQFFG